LAVNHHEQRLLFVEEKVASRDLGVLSRPTPYTTTTSPSPPPNGPITPSRYEPLFTSLSLAYVVSCHGRCRSCLGFSICYVDSCEDGYA
jgi:hypothetical protein